jgi:hypothetical protein
MAMANHILIAFFMKAVYWNQIALPPRSVQSGPPGAKEPGAGVRLERK